MPNTIKTVALADAMFSIDTPDFQGVKSYPNVMSWGARTTCVWGGGGSPRFRFSACSKK